MKDLPQISVIFEEEAHFLDALRKSSFSLGSLPDAITIPALAEGDQADLKPLLLATVDDIAFAQQGLAQTLDRAMAEMKALHQLHARARVLGAKGADYALEFLRQHGEITS